MSTTTTSIASVLNSLIETCRDGQEGFRTAAENAKSNDFKSLFTELAVQRQLFVGELRRLVAALGEEAQTTGSMGGAIHRGWMDLKAAITHGDQHAILTECERGEYAALDAYRHALVREELPDHILRAIERQFLAISKAHDRIQLLRNRLTHQPVLG
jgi:uncharacterized protein (TIGR02284 family)